MRFLLFIFKIVLGAVLVLSTTSCKQNSSIDFIHAYKQDSLLVDSVFAVYQAYSNSDSANASASLNGLLQELNALPQESDSLQLMYLCKVIQRESAKLNVELSDSLIQVASDLSKKISPSKYQVYMLHALGVDNWTKRNIDSAKKCFSKAAKMAKSYNLINREIAARINLITLEGESQPFDTVVAAFEYLMELCKTNERWDYLGDLSNNLAIRYMVANQDFKALEYLHLARESYDKVGVKENYIRVLNNLAILYRTYGMDSLSHYYYKRVEKIAKETKDDKMYTMAKLNLVVNLIDIHELEKAHSEVSEVREYLVENNLTFNVSFVQCELLFGKIEVKRKNFKKAEKHLLESCKLSKQYNEDVMYIRTVIELASLYLDTKQYRLSEIYAKELLESAKNSQSISDATHASLLLAKINRQLHRNVESFKYYDLYAEKSKELYDTMIVNKMKDLGYYYEIKRKELAAGILQKDKELIQSENKLHEAKIQQQKTKIVTGALLILLLLTMIGITIRQIGYKSSVNRQLKEENQFKDNLFSIVTHDIRSPIISLYHMFQLFSRTPANNSKRKRIEQELLKKSERTIALIDNLLFWTRKQMKGIEEKAERVNIYDLVDNVVYNQIESIKMGHLIFSNRLPKELCITADVNLLNMVFRNLISNAFKYTPVNGRVNVSLVEESKSSCTFLVEDSGKGIPAELKDTILNVQELKSLKGIHGEEGKGIGLSLCKYFLEKGQGKIWFESEVDFGTKFYFTILIQTPSIKE